MLVAAASQSQAVRRLRWALAVCLAGLLVAIAGLVPHFRSSTELVRMRNALLLRPSAAGDFDWTPANVPGGFKLEHRPADPRFATVVRDLKLETLPSDWDRAVAIGRHLLSRVGPHSGGAIQSDLGTTYRRIVEQGHGYCGDFVDVFTGLALAAGIPVRAWAFSFDGFGGSGHIFNEIWDRNANAWRMIDVFNNYYFVDARGTPLSALEFRAALERGGRDLRLLPVEPAAPPRFRYEEKAWAYYRQGLSQWYLWWGNNVFSYDRAPLVRALGVLSRSFEQLGGIVSDVHPQIRVLESADNAAQRKAMGGLRWNLLGVVLLSGLALTLSIAFLAARRRSRSDQ